MCNAATFTLNISISVSVWYSPSNTDVRFVEIFLQVLFPDTSAYEVWLHCVYPLFQDVTLKRFKLWEAYSVPQGFIRIGQDYFLIFLANYVKSDRD